MKYHDPVLLQESVGGLAIIPSGVYVDATFGGGGHSRAILEQLGDDGRLYAFDQDDDAFENAIDDPRFTLIQANFRFMQRFLKFHKVRQVDGILADLGVSSHQFDIAERGFSIRFDAELDMRMDRSAGMTAAEFLNTAAEKELIQIFRKYGELRVAPKLAKRIVNARTQNPITTVAQLKEVAAPLVPARKENQLHAQIFQAIRIHINDEMGALYEMLQQTPELIKTGGRLSVISYHSLEDRPVKRFMRSGLFEGEPERDMFGNVNVPYKQLGKLIVPSDKEIERNNRARSAKLRIAERLEDHGS